jgi:hypothetical protein
LVAIDPPSLDTHTVNVAPLIISKVWPELALRPDAYEAVAGEGGLMLEITVPVWAEALLRPVTLDELEAGQAGALRLSADEWASLVGDEQPFYGRPVARTWMEAATLENAELLVYPNDASDEPNVTVYAPVPIEAGVRLRRQALNAEGEPREDLQPEPCEEQITGRLRDRKVTCVNHNCPGECERTYRPRDGIEILECGCS